MSVIPITIFFSLLLVGIFVGLFAREQRRQRFASHERDSLLPLADETPRLAATAPDHDHDGRDQAHNDVHDHDHDHAHGHTHAHGKGRCGCESGVRPPCTGCLRRTGSNTISSPAPLG